MLKSILLATAFASTLGTTAAFARPVIPSAPAYGSRAHTDWTSLGAVRVGGRRASALEVGRHTGALERLRLIVRDGDMGLETVRVTFGNGRTMVTQMSGRFATIELPGDARFVRAVSIDPAGFARRDRAIVEVLGDRATFARR